MTSLTIAVAVAIAAGYAIFIFKVVKRMKRLKESSEELERTIERLKEEVG